MPKKTKLVKQPSAIYNPAMELQSGDIIIFGMRPNTPTSGNQFVNTAQATLNEEGGHSNTEHSAFILQLDGELKIVHLLGRGFAIESLKQIDKRTTHVYRIRDEEIRKGVAAQLTSLIEEKRMELPQTLHWRGVVSFFAYIRRVINSLGIRNRSLFYHTKLKDQPHDITGASICSKFVADSYNEACRRYSLQQGGAVNYKDTLMNIFSTTTNKTLQAYLSRNTHYDYFVVPHARRNIVEKLAGIVSIEIERLKHKRFCNESKLKGLWLERIVNEYRSKNGDPFDVAVNMLKRLIPILKINNGAVGLAVPRSYRNVMAFAKSQGIYKDMLNEYVRNDTAENRHDVAESLGYTSTEERVYEHFRGRGFSDKEARYEARPDFLSGYALNPRRMAAGALTGVGLFSGAVYVCARTEHTRQRNEMYAPYQQ